MRSESNSDNEAPVPVPQKEEIKTVKVSQPVITEQPKQSQKSNGTRKIVFFNDAEDL